MDKELKLQGTVGEGGKIDCPPVNLPKGTKVEILVTPLTEGSGKPRRRLMDFFGVGKGTFGSEEAILRHLEEERSASEKRFSR